jgi:hypothetical protein
MACRFQADGHWIRKLGQGRKQLIKPGTAIIKGESRLDDLAFVIHN